MVLALPVWSIGWGIFLWRKGCRFSSSQGVCGRQPVNVLFLPFFLSKKQWGWERWFYVMYHTVVWWWCSFNRFYTKHPVVFHVLFWITNTAVCQIMDSFYLWIKELADVTSHICFLGFCVCMCVCFFLGKWLFFLRFRQHKIQLMNKKVQVCRWVKMLESEFQSQMYYKNHLNCLLIF